MGDVTGRTKMYKNIVDSNHMMDAGVRESFNVLVKEIRSLGVTSKSIRNGGNPQPERDTRRVNMKDLLKLLSRRRPPGLRLDIFIGLLTPGDDPLVVVRRVKPETINYRTFKPGGTASSAQIFRAREGHELPLRQYKRLKAPRRRLRSAASRG